MLKYLHAVISIYLVKQDFNIMKKTNNIFRKIYPLNESTGLCTIEIALNQYEDIFNKYDSAPLERREIDPELETYLKRCCEEIPSKYSLELDISIPAKIRENEKEEKLRDALKNHFSFQVYLIKNKRNRNNLNVIFDIFSGFFLLWIVAIWEVDISRILLSVIENGIVIGGWVFLWDAVSRFFFTKSKLNKSYQNYERLLNSSIIFREI